MTVPVTLANYDDPYKAVSDFEQKLSNLTGAPFVVTTDSCTHALELCIRLNKRHVMNPIGLPAKTYISVPMMLHKIGLQYEYTDYQWFDEYELKGTNIWDSARRCQQGMYMPDTMQCLSFGHGKPLEIGRGGAILLDNYEDYNLLKTMSYDGRDLRYNKWEHQKTFAVGYHYMMRPEEAIKGLNLLEENKLNPLDQHKYPDLRKINII